MLWRPLHWRAVMRPSMDAVAEQAFEVIGKVEHLFEQALHMFVRQGCPGAKESAEEGHTANNNARTMREAQPPPRAERAKAPARAGAQDK